MINRIKALFTPRKKLITKNEKEEILIWKQNGCPSPPPHVVKQNIIKEYKKKYNSNVFVETGTYLGDMVEVQKNNFQKVYSIELGEKLWENAKLRFKDDKNVIIIQGDSGDILNSLIKEINEPAIFWLDGHYSAGITAMGKKECPIYEELNAIFSDTRFNHILLIDDARLFTGQNDYPTIEDLTNFVLNKNSKYEIEIIHDIIRFTKN